MPSDEFSPWLAEQMSSRDFRRSWNRTEKFRRGSAHMGCPVAVKPAFVGRRHGW